MKKLTYKKYGKSDNIILIDLNNGGYSVVAIKMWDRENKEYEVEFRLQENSIENWNYISTNREFKYKATFQTINSAILKTVAGLLNEGFFDKYINDYEEELMCYNKGVDLLDAERKKNAS